jgi:hypothetical protein
MTFIRKKKEWKWQWPTKKSWPNFLGITWLPKATWAHCNGIKSLCNGAKETWYFNARLGQVSKKMVALSKWAKFSKKHDNSTQPKWGNGPKFFEKRWYHGANRPQFSSANMISPRYPRKHGCPRQIGPSSSIEHGYSRHISPSSLDQTCFPIPSKPCYLSRANFVFT